MNPKLIERMQLKRDLLAAGDLRHAEIRLLLFILGGGMGGVNGAYGAIALRLLGFSDVFDVVAGSSTGAPIGMYFLGGAPSATVKGMTIYTDLLAGRFVRYFPFPKLRLALTSRAFRKGKRRVNVAAVLASRSDFFVAVAEPDTATTVFLDAKQAQPDLITAVDAAIAIPGILHGSPVAVNGKSYCDNSFAHPFAIQTAVERFQPTDVLVITNRPISERAAKDYSLGDRLYATVGMRRESRALREAFKQQQARWAEGWRYFDALPSQGINTGELWSPVDPGNFGMDRQLVRTAGEAAFTAALQAFGRSAADFPPPSSLMAVWKRSGAAVSP